MTLAAGLALGLALLAEGPGWAHAPESTGVGCSHGLRTDDNPACDIVTPDYWSVVCAAVRKTWAPPGAAQWGRHGAVQLHGFIEPDGAITRIETRRLNGARTMEQAARQALILASPLEPPQFADPARCEHAGITLDFFYNMSEKAREKWAKQK
jgi:hypothetical protein